MFLLARMFAGVRRGFAHGAYNGATLRTGTELANIRDPYKVSVAKRRRSQCLSTLRFKDNDQENHEFSLSSALGNTPPRARSRTDLLHYSKSISL